jgi:hypothetical protein
MKLFTPLFAAGSSIGGDQLAGSSLTRKNISRLVSWCLLTLAIVSLVRLAPTLTTPEVIASDDFLRFWAGGRLNLHGENPYDLARITQLQVEAGDTSTGQNSLMLNPPWAITLIMPYGYPDYPVSRLLWLLSSTVLILISALMLWQVYSTSPKQRWIALLTVFIFAPTISMLEKGQITKKGLVGRFIPGYLNHQATVDHPVLYRPDLVDYPRTALGDACQHGDYHLGSNTDLRHL